MTWNTFISALGFVFAATALMSLLGYPRLRRSRGLLQDYLLAGGGLTKVPVLNLLLSTSFGINTMLYQGYLGATVGFWGLVIQGAWAGGFWLLRSKVSAIRSHEGLHHFLDIHFGAATRVTAALFSLIGITVFLGWETSIGREAFAGIVSADASVGRPFALSAANWLIAGVVAGCLIYTLLGGLRGNAWANVGQNILKFCSFTLVTVLLARAFFTSGDSVGIFQSAFFPSLSTMQATLGFVGLVTSLAFGLAWQFVDMSTWQSIAASAQASDADLRWNLKWTAILVFITPGVLGTLFGMFLFNTPGAAANVLVAASQVITDAGPIVQFLFAAAIIAAVMSLIDGLFLAGTYALVVDIIHRDKSLEELDRDEVRASRTLNLARVLLAGIAVVSVWGVPKAIALLGDRDLFFFSFVVVVAQLALLGPVLVALSRPSHVSDSERPASSPMWIAIILSGVLGFSCAFYGGVTEQKFFTDVAGTATIIFSIALALALDRRHRQTRGF